MSKRDVLFFGWEQGCAFGAYKMVHKAFTQVTYEIISVMENGLLLLQGEERGDKLRHVYVCVFCGAYMCAVVHLQNLSLNESMLGGWYTHTHTAPAQLPVSEQVEWNRRHSCFQFSFSCCSPQLSTETSTSESMQKIKPHGLGEKRQTLCHCLR